MRLLTKKFKSISEQIKEAETSIQNLVEVSDSDFQELLKKVGNKQNYIPIPEKIDALPNYLKLVVAFANTYEIDLTVDSEIYGVSVKFYLVDPTMPNEMTKIFGRIITASDGLSIWTKSNDADYDHVVSLDFNTHMRNI